MICAEEKMSVSVGVLRLHALHFPTPTFTCPHQKQVIPACFAAKYAASFAEQFRAFCIASNIAPTLESTAVCLNDARFLEGSVCAALADSLQCASRNGQCNGLIEFRYKNLSLLEVSLSADFNGRVELGCASSVRIAPSCKG